MKWLIIICNLVFVVTLVTVVLLNRRDKKRAQIYYVTIENGKIKPFAGRF